MTWQDLKTNAKYRWDRLLYSASTFLLLKCRRKRALCCSYTLTHCTFALLCAISSLAIFSFYIWKQNGKRQSQSVVNHRLSRQWYVPSHFRKEKLTKFGFLFQRDHYHSSSFKLSSLLFVFRASETEKNGTPWNSQRFGSWRQLMTWITCYRQSTQVKIQWYFLCIKQF